MFSSALLSSFTDDVLDAVGEIHRVILLSQGLVDTLHVRSDDLGTNLLGSGKPAGDLDLLCREKIGDSHHLGFCVCHEAQDIK